MNLLQKIPNYKIIELILIFIAFFYYSLFANKGLVLFDEGYFVHAADRILNGEVPYKDFSLQYGPVYFYILALFFKLFGASIIVERFFTIGICLLILLTTFLILNKTKINSYLVIFLSFLCIIAYGYPLINIPNIMWANVLTALLAMLTYLHWYSAHGNRKYVYLLLMGLLLALSLCLKQNIGLVCLFMFNLFILFSKKRSILQVIQEFAILNGTCIILTLVWIYYFFLRDNFSALLEIIAFSKKFASSISFTIPPLTFITQPLGLFKLLPYYTPIVFGLFLLGYLFHKSKDWRRLSFALMSVTGFAATIFPQSDLLHVYPFLGITLVALLIFSYNSKLKLFAIGLLILHIMICFYLTLFTKSYRYEAPYSQMNTPLTLPRTSGVLITNHDATNLIAVSKYIKTHTKEDDYIFVYPYAPMLYFIFERKNPTKDPIYYQPTWHFYEDQVALSDMKQKKVKYIVTVGEYKYKTELSKFIQQQKRVSTSGNIEVFQITSWE